MKISNIFASLAAFVAVAVCAPVDIVNWEYTDITIGDTYTVELVTKAKQTQEVFQLALIQKCFVGNCAWKVIRNIGYELDVVAPGLNFTWTVGANIPPGDGYALWSYDFKKGTLKPAHTSQTNWFTISAPSASKDRRAIEWEA